MIYHFFPANFAILFFYVDQYLLDIRALPKLSGHSWVIKPRVLETCNFFQNNKLFSFTINDATLKYYS